MLKIISPTETKRPYHGSKVNINVIGHIWILRGSKYYIKWMYDFKQRMKLQSYIEFKTKPNDRIE